MSRAGVCGMPWELGARKGSGPLLLTGRKKGVLSIRSLLGCDIVKPIISTEPLA